MKHEIEPQDIALAEFRSLFQQPCRSVMVSDNGHYMRLGKDLPDRVAAEWYLLASRIIRENRLPLVAEVVEWRAGAVIYDRFLKIEFVPSLSLLPCY
jgi:hypothetical protein